MEETVLVQYCKTSDYNAETNVCAAPFYGVHEGLLPALSAADGVLISATIMSAWAIGFMVKQGRRSAS